MDTSLKDSLSSALLQAMDIVSKKAASETDTTLTVEAKIVEAIDEGKGIYKVQYLGNTFEATSANTEFIYAVDQMVYILVPGGNFDNNKIILSPVLSSDVTYASIQEGSSYVTLGDNLFASVADVELCTYRPQDADPAGTGLSPYVDIDTTGFAQLFISALKDSRTFNFTCRIKTNIDKSRRSKGNYGLILDIPVIQENNEKIYSVVLDINNLKGDPYNYMEYALQNVYFELPADMEYDTSRLPDIRAFVGGFIGEYSATAPTDIWIKDIGLLSSFVLNTEEMSGYYLLLTATEGTSFLATRTEDNKIITPTLYLNGKTTKVENFDCYWFKENCLVDAESDKYNRLGGLGWEILNEKTGIEIEEGGKETYQYVTNVYQLKVFQNDIHSTTRFKCVLVNGDKVVNQIINIKNLASSAELELVSATGSNIYVENVGKVRLILRYYEAGITDVSSAVNVSYAWQRFDKFGNYIDNNFYVINRLNDKVIINGKSYFETEISYFTNDIDTLNTVYCTVYLETVNDGKVKQIIAGTRSILISTSPEATYNIRVENGDKLYKYDSDGDSPKVANYDGPLSSAIKEITPINITLFKPDGTEFTADEYSVTTVEWLVPINSMISLTIAQKTDPASNPGYYTIKGNYSLYKSLNYNIVNVYNKKKTDNTIIIKAYFKDNIAENVANIRFLKEGESGTNGSKYSAIVTYNGAGYGERTPDGKINKLQLIYAVDQNQWYKYNPAIGELVAVPNGSAIATFEVDTYADGEKITNSDIVWSIFDKNYNYNSIVNPININYQGEAILNSASYWIDDEQNFCSTIEAKVRAKGINADDGQTNGEEYVYAYYPIELIRVVKYEYLGKIIPTFDGGFFQVVYAADGTNPQYDNSNDFIVINEAEDLYTYTWSSSDCLSVRPNVDKSCKVIPTSKFDNGKAKNFIKVKINTEDGAAESLAQKIIELQNEIMTQNSRLSYYNTLQDALDIFQNFEYNDYINDLQTASGFFTTKTNLVKIDQDLLTELNDILTKINIYYQEDQSIKLTNLKNEIIDKINQFTNLLNLSYQLGVNLSATNLIKAITPNSLLINNIVVETGDKSYYITLRDMVAKYNSQINVVYYTYYNELDDAFVALEGLVKVVYDELENYVNNSKWTTLKSSHYGIDEQVYLYAGLVQNLQTYINNFSSNDNYSYDKIINNILKPIKKALEQFDNIDYFDLIIKINENINQLNTKLIEYQNIRLPQNENDIIYIQPIIMTYNRYEMSNINGWDGNKLVLDDNGRYIVAPQVGAGIKNNNNTFTGIVMGVKQENSGSTSGQQVGLFGYSSGQQSIFLNARDGSATFGVAGAGQIIMDPSNNTAIIKSGNYSTAAGTGMQINLTAPEIRFGSGRFVVDSGGNLNASNATISGNITATSGYIGGWKINTNTLTGGNITLDSAGAIMGTGWSIGTDGVGRFTNVIITGGAGGSVSEMNWNNKFKVDTTGKLTATGADIKGKITATSGSIGGITIQENSIYSSNELFSVTKDGNLTAKSGNINGFRIDSDLGLRSLYPLGYLYISSISGEVYTKGLNVLTDAYFGSKAHSDSGEKGEVSILEADTIECEILHINDSIFYYRNDTPIDLIEKVNNKVDIGIYAVRKTQSAASELIGYVNFFNN